MVKLKKIHHQWFTDLETLRNHTHNDVMYIWQNINVFMQKMKFQVLLCHMEFNIYAPVLSNLLISLRKSYKMIGEHRIYHLFSTYLIDSIKYGHSCKIL